MSSQCCIVLTNLETAPANNPLDHDRVFCYDKDGRTLSKIKVQIRDTQAYCLLVNCLEFSGLSVGLFQTQTSLEKAPVPFLETSNKSCTATRYRSLSSASFGPSEGLTSSIEGSHDWYNRGPKLQNCLYSGRLFCMVITSGEHYAIRNMCSTTGTR